jgi:hypothetical protein
MSRVLKRLGLSKLSALEPAEPPRRYQRERPGEMIHIDIKKLGRFKQVGHRITGDRKGQGNGRGVGWEFLHVCIDDASRVASVLTFAAMAVERLYEGHARTARPEAAASSKGMRGISSGLSTRASRWSSASVKYLRGPHGLKRIRAPRYSPTWLASIGFGSVPSKLGGSIMPELLKQFTVDGVSL